MQVLLSMCLWSYKIHAVLTKSCELIVVCAANNYSLRVVSKDPQVSRQNQWWLFQVTCRPNIPVSDPQYSAVLIFIFSSCLSVVAVNVVVVSKDPCCLYEHGEVL